MSSNQNNKKPARKTSAGASMSATEITDFFREFELTVRRMAGRVPGLRLQDLDDFVQYISLWAWSRPDLRERYAPRALAAAAVNQRAVDFFRKEARGLPQGGYDHREKKVHNAIWYLDHIVAQNDDDDTVTLGDVIAAKGDLVEEFIDHQKLEEALLTLTPQQRSIFILVEGLQYKVTEVASMLGFKREWAQRELGKARKAMSGYTRTSR